MLNNFYGILTFSTILNPTLSVHVIVTKNDPQQLLIFFKNRAFVMSLNYRNIASATCRNASKYYLIHKIRVHETIFYSHNAQQALYKSNRQSAAMNKEAEMSYKKVSKTKNIGKESPIT